MKKNLKIKENYEDQFYRNFSEVNEKAVYVMG